MRVKSIKTPIFLVYDSRSGSTLLSRLLSSNLKNTSITQEIGFEEILKQNDTKDKKIWNSALEKTKKYHDLRNSKVNIDRLKSLVNKAETISKKVVFDAILSEVMAEYPNKFIIIKNGRHIKYLQELNRLENNNIKVIYIHRDPRAVISSKLSTPRPYYPKEKMAWGGAYMATLQWKKYAQYISTYPVADHILKVSFEELIENQEKTLNRIALFIGDERVVDKQSDYRLPKREESIHSLVSKKPDKSRLTAWKEELTNFQIKQIECVLGHDHFELERKNNFIWCLIIKMLSAVEIIFKSARHYIYHSLNKLANN